MFIFFFRITWFFLKAIQRVISYGALSEPGTYNIDLTHVISLSLSLSLPLGCNYGTCLVTVDGKNIRPSSSCPPFFHFFLPPFAPRTTGCAVFPRNLS